MTSGTRGTYSEELQKQSVLPIAKLKLEDSVGSNLGYCRQPPGLEELSKPSDKCGGGRSCCSSKLGQVAAKAGINDELLLVIGLRELEEKDLGGEVVDVG
jgi:hypothetical protein